jgi:lysophospholipase L1-like esterase
LYVKRRQGNTTKYCEFNVGDVKALNKKMSLLFCTVTTLIITLCLIFNQINVSALSPQKRSINIVAIGDSLTYGSGDPLKKGYIHRVKTGIEETYNVSASLTNFGVSGYRTEQVIQELKDSVKQKTIQKADYILLFIGTNDFRKSANYKFDTISVKKMIKEKKNYSKQLFELITFIRKENQSAPLIVLGLYNPYTQEKTKETIDLLIADWNKEIRETTSYFNRTIYVPTADLFPTFKKEYYFSDTLHPNPKGYQVIANRVLKYVRNNNPDDMKNKS